MSVIKIELSELAKEDLRDILLFTFQRWGQKQLDLYEKKINKAFAEIFKNPKSDDKRVRFSVYPVGVTKFFTALKPKRSTLFASCTKAWTRHGIYPKHKKISMPGFADPHSCNADTAPQLQGVRIRRIC